MAFDPIQEDYERLVLRSYQNEAPGTAPEAELDTESFTKRFFDDPGSLPQTDADRAFRLVGEAAVLIDCRLPFASDYEATHMISKADALLTNALALDPASSDAMRMLAASQGTSFETYYRYLVDGRAEAKARADAVRESWTRPGASPTEAYLVEKLSSAPYIRWIAAESDRALICGHYRAALRAADDAWALDPSDPGGVTMTAAYAYAKLQDEEGFARLIERMHEAGFPENAWTRIARLSLAFSFCRYDDAEAALKTLVDSYHDAVEIVLRHQELPDGVYSRLAIQPDSEDELVLALSEAAVLLQEGRDSEERGSLSSWLRIGLAPFMGSRAKKKHGARRKEDGR